MKRSEETAMTDEMDSKFWNDEYEVNPQHIMVEERLLDAEVKDMTPGRALDLGCGTGQHILKLTKRGWSVTGVDWAERAIEIARRSAEKMHADANFIAADITAWRPDRIYDLVFCSYALPSGEGRRKALKTAADALAAGGTLLVAEWDHSMCEVWGFKEDDLLPPEAIAAMLPALIIEKAEVRRFENLFDDEDQRKTYGDSVNVAFVRARKERKGSE